MSQTKIANRISIGDSHDLSIEWFMTYTAFPVYEIERVGAYWKITGTEKKEVKDARKADEKKPEEKPAASVRRTTKSGGKRGKSGTKKSGRK